jgi:hypothetical protein
VGDDNVPEQNCRRRILTAPTAPAPAPISWTGCRVPAAEEQGRQHCTRHQTFHSAHRDLLNEIVACILGCAFLIQDGSFRGCAV